jgi:hypothetical protein
MVCSHCHLRSAMCTHEPLAQSLFLLPSIVSGLAFVATNDFLIIQTDADIVCERAKNHYDPGLDMDETETLASGAGSSTVQRYKDLYRPTHEGMRYKM